MHDRSSLDPNALITGISFRPLLWSFFVLCLPSAHVMHAQQANVWYFGNKAGLDFNSGIPVPLLDGQMIAYEGCASIADENGDLRFYTNGGPVSPAPYDFGAVWDNAHDVMPNGDLNFAGGCTSASQAALIVQDPGNDEHYYAFTLDCAENQFVGGLRYSEVEMVLNGGLGDVTTIGTPLLSGTGESMIGIRHANGTDVWLLVHGEPPSNLYYSFLITALGIGGPSVMSVGPVSGTGGQLATDLLGRKVHYAGLNHSVLFDFDTATGILSNPIDLQRSDINGCAFASGGQYLYTSEQMDPHRVFQYDLLASDIPASEQIIGSGTTIQTGMQLAPDGKIYISRGEQGYLGVISDPDAAGTAAGYQEEGLYLGGRTGLYALPNFVNDLLHPYTVGIAEGVVALLQCIVNGDELHVRGGAALEHGSLSIFRSDGTLVYEGRLTESTVAIPIASFAPGVGVVRVTNGQRTGTARFVSVR